MSSVGQALGGLVGGVVGFMVGGPTGALYGAQVGMGVGGYLDPPKGPIIQGPRLDDLTVQTATYGAFVPRNYGTVAQTGNIFWLQGDALTEVKQSTTSGGKGAPSATTVTWSYYATFAVGLCEGPIDGVRRIWIGGQLWYDAGSDSAAEIIASNQVADQFTLYLGTDTQDPDPLIQADKGAANVPAYRGLSYIVFDTLPLEKYGNSLMQAQVKVEIVKDATFAGPRLIDSATVDGYPLKYYPRPNIDADDGLLTFYGYDPFAGTATVDGELIGTDEALIKILLDGTYLNAAPINTDEDDQIIRPQMTSAGTTTVEIGFLNGNAVWWPEKSSTYAIQNGTYSIIPWGSITGRDTAAVTADLGDIADSLTGEAGRYVIGLGISPSGNRIIVTTGATSRGASIVADRYFILDDSLNILASGDIAVTTAKIWSIGQTSLDLPNGATTIADDGLYGWIVSAESISAFDVRYFYVDSAGDMQMSAALTTVITHSGYAAACLTDGIFYVLIRTSTLAKLYWYTAFATITGAAATLGDIVEAECLTSNILTAGDLDVTELTDSVRGYRVSTLSAIRGGIDPLRAAWPFDVVQHGYDIQFKMRGSASVATIPADDLDARPAGESPAAEITDTREMDLILPRKVSVKYLDVVREYDFNEQEENRINTDAVNINIIDLPIVLNADEAKQTASMLLYLYWMERYDVTFRLPPTYLELEPGDVIDITADNADYNLRLTQVNYLPDGRLECRAKYNAATIYTQTSQGEDGASTGSLLTPDGPTALVLLDIPLMRDDDDTAGFPVAMGGYFTAWPSGIIYRSTDNGETWTDLEAVAGPGAVIGSASNTLSSHGGTLLDKASRLSVRLNSGTLSSVTEAQMFAGQNWFAYGIDGRWEIIAAQNCTLQADGSYILTDFMRGQNGTEWATGLHEYHDTIVLLDEASLEFVSVNSSTIGVEYIYRAITSGKAMDSAADEAFTYAGVNLECLSPINLTGYNHSSNNWELTWTRRSRYAGWRDYIDAPLGESTESWAIEVYSSGTYATLKRTLTSTTNAVQYSSANQITDFGSNQSTLYLKIYQLSATVGRGYPLTASITR